MATSRIVSGRGLGAAGAALVLGVARKPAIRPKCYVLLLRSARDGRQLPPVGQRRRGPKRGPHPLPPLGRRGSDAATRSKPPLYCVLLAAVVAATGKVREGAGL